MRKREANIRAEIEAQLGVKRSEIRDRLSSLTQQMDDFKAMAEVKMRESIEGKVQSQIDADEARLADQQEEFDRLRSKDNRAEKRQSWLQAISGQGTQAQQPQMGVDPSALGARPTALGANAGRPIRGAMAQAAAQHSPSMGLSGMRAPQSAAKALSGAQPLARPVKAPIGAQINPAQQIKLPQPILPKVVRQPVVQQPVIQRPKVEAPAVVAPEIKPVAEQIVSAPKLEIAEAIPEQTVIEETILPEIEEEIEEIVQPELEEIQLEEVEIEDVVSEVEEALVSEEPEEIKPEKTAVLRPITKLEAVEKATTAVLKPVSPKVLTPAKRRGPPPSSAPGVKPTSTGVEKKTATLTPVTKLNPVNSPNTELNIDSNEDEQ